MNKFQEYNITVITETDNNFIRGEKWFYDDI